MACRFIPSDTTYYSRFESESAICAYIPDNILRAVGLFRLDVFVASCIDLATSIRQMAKVKEKVAPVSSNDY